MFLLVINQLDCIYCVDPYTCNPQIADCIHVKLVKSLNDGNTVNQLQCQVIKDPEKKLRIQLGFEPRTF